MLVMISGSLVTKTNHVEQVFYVPDLAKKNWSVVMPEKRIVGIENVVEQEQYNQFDKIPSFDTSYKPQLLELTKHRTCEETIVKRRFEWRIK
jgi:hypothetical protein